MFELLTKDLDAGLFLLKLLNGSGVQVKVFGRVIVTLLDCSADDIPEDCLAFEFED